MKADTLNNSAPFFSRSSQLRGLVCMIVASLMFSLMNVCVYAIGLCDPQLPSTVVSFVRLLINLIILLVPAVWAGDCLGLFGDLRLSLWLRGLFGSLALMLSFASIQMIGPGESAFLAASIAQFFLTVSYQITPAALVSAAGYLSPVLSLVWGVALFSRVPDSKSLIGCGLVLFFGVLLPFLGAAGKK
ncbi:MAG: hypothetical protein WCI11_06580 [Candidatus Methylumidiphilus sp.]